MREEEVLIREAQAGDPARFGELVQPHTAGLLRELQNVLGNRADAEDVLQETLVKVWVALPSFRFEGRFDNWLRKIARNMGLSALRRRAASRVAQLAQEPAVGTVHDNPESRAIAAQKLEGIAGALKGLTPEQREVFVLRIFAGLPFREIAALQGKSKDDDDNSSDG